ncbi:MAG: alpha/beta hydrolase-fold protein [Pseudohongiella sp.]
MTHHRIFTRLLSGTFTLILSLAGSLLLAQEAEQTISAAQPSELPAGLQTVSFFSPAVSRQMKFDIVLPPDYSESDARYPVLYLLHGYMQNYTVWGRNLGAAFYARSFSDLIVVMPDAGNSWYINYASSEGNQRNNWEDHIVRDVIGHVDSNFRTLASREGRSIAGLSMGGYGAVMLGLRHPGLFISVASTSGALAHARNRATAIAEGQPAPVARSIGDSPELARADAFISQIIDIPGFSSQDERNPRGTDFETVEQAEAYDPFHIIYDVPKSRLPHIYLDSGVDDGLITATHEFMQILLLNDVPFAYMQSQGRHNSEYWRRSIGHLMSVQYEVMQRALGNRP